MSDSHVTQQRFTGGSGEDSSPSQAVTGVLENLLQPLLKVCRSLESTTFRMTLTDLQTGEDTFSEEGSLLKLLGYLPECLSRLSRWNEVLTIQSCSPAQEEVEELDLER